MKSAKGTLLSDVSVINSFSVTTCVYDSVNVLTIGPILVTVRVAVLLIIEIAVGFSGEIPSVYKVN